MADTSSAITVPDFGLESADTSFEGLRGDNELAWRLSHLQRLIHPFGGELFGLKYNKDDASTHYKPCLDVLPRTCLIEVTLGGTSFYACQKFAKLHPYSQFVLKALHGVDFRHPMCYIPDGRKYEVKSNRAVFSAMQTAHRLYTLAVTHLYYLMTAYTATTDSAHYDHRFQQELEDCSKAHALYPLMFSNAKERGVGPLLSPLDRMKMEYSEGIMSKAFIKLARCPAPSVPVPEFVNLCVGRTAPFGDKTVPSTTLVAETGFSFEPTPNYFNGKIRFYTGRVWEPTQEYIDVYLSKATPSPSKLANLKVDEPGVYSAGEILQLKFAHIVILHPALHLETTVPMSEIGANAGVMLAGILNGDDDADYVVRRLTGLQKWMDIESGEIENAPLGQTVQLMRTFV